MIHKLVGSLTVVVCLLLSGCSIAGQWEATGTGAGDFQLARATFNNDKTYESTAQYKGQTRTSKGKYSFNSSKLTLTPDDGGPQRTYGACVGLDGKTLKVKYTPEQGKPVSVTMKKVCCPKDCACCKKPS